MADDVVVLNDGLARRTSAAGKTRYTVLVRSEPLICDLDPKKLGAGPALAIAAVFRERISSIGEVASEATKRARVGAAKAFAAGQLWALKRYSGGKTGAMPPNQSDRVFNDSGRFVKSIAVGATKDGYVINTAANRMDPSTLKDGEAGLQRMWARLVSLVPELAAPEMLMDSIPVRSAIKKGLEESIVKARETQEKLSDGAIRAYVRVGEAVLEIARTFGVG